MSRAQLEKKYGIIIVEDGYYDWNGRYIRLYNMYSADGCPWEKGLRTVKDIEAECRTWAKTLLDIKEYVANPIMDKAIIF